MTAPRVEFRDWVAGEAIPPAASETLRLQDPNTGAARAPMVTARPATIEAALACAHDVHRRRVWSGLPKARRAEILEEIADAVAQRVDTLGRLGAETTGVVITQTERFAGLTPILFKQAAALTRGEAIETFSGPHSPVEVHRLPLGPALCIAPWNAPTAIAAHKVAAALAAGCPTILKPSEYAPHTANVLAEAIAESALPPGVFQLLHGAGDVGAALTADPRIRAVSFTGGLAGGRAVAVSCAQQMKPAQLELGGNNPLVVLADADLDLAADGVVDALRLLNGQWCRALGRLLVHRSVQGPLLEAVAARLTALKVGASVDRTSEMGPLIHRGHWQTVNAAVDGLKARGGTAHAWSELPADGFFCAPTLVTGCASVDTTDEIFGPVAAVHGFETEDEMFDLVHQAPYGLAAYIFGDEERALSWARRFEIGSTKVNGVSVTSLNPHAPRPAWRLSGLGVEGHTETFEFFRGLGVVGVAGGRA